MLVTEDANIAPATSTSPEDGQQQVSAPASPANPPAPAAAESNAKDANTAPATSPEDGQQKISAPAAPANPLAPAAAESNAEDANTAPATSPEDGQHKISAPAAPANPPAPAAAEANAGGTTQTLAVEQPPTQNRNDTKVTLPDTVKEEAENTAAPVQTVALSGPIDVESSEDEKIEASTLVANAQPTTEPQDVSSSEENLPLATLKVATHTQTEKHAEPDASTNVATAAASNLAEGESRLETNSDDKQQPDVSSSSSDQSSNTAEEDEDDALTPPRAKAKGKAKAKAKAKSKAAKASPKPRGKPTASKAKAAPKKRLRKLQSQPVVEEEAADVGVVGKEKLMQIRPRTRGRCVRAGVLNRIGHLTNYIQHRTTVTNDRLIYIII